jgi:serine phosphatase RsbU (regulator of sigma subunit)
MCGHGPDEAALGVALRIAWRTLVLAGHAGDDIVRGVERVLLAERNDDARFATIAMVSVDPAGTQADVLLCGHPAPLLISGGEVRELTGPALPMLTLLRGRFESFTVDLDADWGLFMFTDGLFEGRSSPGAKSRLGIDELVRQLQSLVTEEVPRAELAPRLLSVAERCNGGPLTDDVAVLLVGSPGWWF